MRPRQVYDFFGRKVSLFLSISVAVGLSLFLVEIVFALSLQLFLYVLGLARLESLGLPAWLPEPSLPYVLGLIVVLALFRSVLLWAQDYLRVASVEHFKHLQRERLLDWTFASQSASTPLIVGLFGERTTRAALVVKYLQVMLLQLTTSALLAGALFYMSPLISLSAFALIVLIGVPLRTIVRKVRESGKSMVADWDRAQNRLILSIRNLLLLRIYALENLEKAKAKKHLGAYVRHNLIFNRNSGFLSVIPIILGALVICSITYVSRTRNLMPAGKLLSFFYLFIRCTDNLSSISASFSNFVFEWPQFKELMGWWSRHKQKLESVAKDARKVEHVQAPLEPMAWHCQNITFCYEGSPAILKNYDLSIPSGKTTIIVGPSGVGKSTLLNLLLGEASPQSGQVKVSYDGSTHNLADVRPTVLSGIGYVGAESFLIEGTIRENLMYGNRGSPTDNDLEKALITAECQFVFNFPNKLDHTLTEQGQGLSAGQKQRLALAKALLRKPKALILDEATANLDSDTEMKLVTTLASLKGQMTIIGVTHRQSLLTIADQIIRLG